MKINNVTQAPFGTILSLSDALPENSVGHFLTVDGNTLHKIEGTPSNLWSEVLVARTTDIHVGQEINILKIA
ncbi:TPA: hypothetical protein U1W00_001510 [Streptococcus suis]|uniref:hypothetical protein n=1 Tax=Streptococcus suis TaxID=1307 RepID=UPI00155243AA|nr:hypothetical protein [Streptococcus suis]MDG4506383.1 hypothetical protein [Streptococcus suis]NQL18022.1 hypothetical protein [Streptococcus suis]NQM41521.1 hypothetical protein [Streptococcus suis]HEL2202505.1 hypothetical protein [Streptococcus suis]HEM2820498.1 hypothetical protein [Streptococcus suis]